ncbi:TetR family transcriptional regulator [Rhodococcus erythropolis]|uniref:TetR family transcriptional regulator n=1 Tax=Rhodococcus erythropolis TaxID=1833 RepID=A0A5N5DVJ9_RHOER|nr:TetR family transcriptional regulator [Rhodococcus erythropolis]
MFLAGERLDMLSLAERLGISRATLYRWVGKREELLGQVLGEATERSYRRAMSQTAGRGLDYVLDLFERVILSVYSSSELRALAEREPMVLIRIMATPGAVESIAVSMTSEVLAKEVDAGELTLALPPRVMSTALYRIALSYLYIPLLNGGEAQVETALELISLLLCGGQKMSEIPESEIRQRFEFSPSVDEFNRMAAS